MQNNVQTNVEHMQTIKTKTKQHMQKNMQNQKNTKNYTNANN